MSLLRTIPLFQGLSESELESVQACLREKSFGKGEIIFSEGQMCERIFIVQKGCVNLYRLASSGREQVLETLGRGDTCACNPGSSIWSCATTAEAVTPCTVWYLSRDAYVRLVQTNSQFARTLNRLFAEKLRCFSSLIEEVSLKDVKKRLVKFLLDMRPSGSKAQNQEQAIAIPFTQEEIAQRLGAARETVSRYLSELKDKKLIEIKSRQLVIPSPAALEKLLC